MTTAVVVPVRCFFGAMSRLSGVLDISLRAELMRQIATRVVTAASPYPTYVATDDDEVADWADSLKVRTVRVRQPGLSAAATAAVDQLAKIGVNRVVVAHADLPLARTLSPAIGPGLVITPDRHRDGSNVICVPTAAGFTFAYGKGSFRRHIAEAERLDIPVTIVDDITLATDIDQPSDLLSLPANELTSLGVSAI